MVSKNIVFRVDSGVNIGTGHLTRCITLAKALRKRAKINCMFICRPHLGNVSSMVLEHDFTLLMLPKTFCSVVQNDCKSWLGASQIEDAAQSSVVLKKNKIENIDLLIFDHYAINYEWQDYFSTLTSKILVIDDLADRRHECDFLLDQNFAFNYKRRYDTLVPDKCKKFLGVSYCLLKDDFFTIRKSVKPRHNTDNLLVFFGGIDKDNCTERLLVSLAGHLAQFKCIDVVVGIKNPNKCEIERICFKYENCFYHEQISNMAELIARADFSIGACGATTGERIFLGLPTIVFSVADNQVQVSQFLHETESVHYVGAHTLISFKTVQLAINEYLGSREKIARISSKLLAENESNLDFMINSLNSIEGFV